MAEVPGKNGRRRIFDEIESQEAWSRARRGVAFQKFACALQGCSLDLISFEDARQLLHLNQKICLGLHQVELEKIKGSVGRYHDFTSTFLPRREGLSQRWQQVRSASISKGLPPIELYKLGDAYFVLDGNHRVSIARMEDRHTIEAYVCEYISPPEFSDEADFDKVLCKMEYAEFRKRTGLKLEHDIVFTVPGRYMEIESQIQSVQDLLQGQRGETISFKEAAREWYRAIYTPTVKDIRESRVLVLFPERTEADIFIWLWRNEPDLQIYAAPDTDKETE